MNPKADIHTTKFQSSINGIKATVKYKNQILEINTKLIGEYNMYNILAACTASLSVGINSEKIEHALLTLPPIPGRLEQITSNCPGSIFIDYAHTPDAYEKLFSTINNLKDDHKIITIFGCGGNRDSNKRKDMVKKYIVIIGMPLIIALVVDFLLFLVQTVHQDGKRLLSVKIPVRGAFHPK